MKKFMPTLIAFIVLMALMVYSNYYEVEEKILPGMTPPETLVNGDFDEIRSVEYVNGENKGVKLVKKAGETAKITSPKYYLADPAKANQILSRLANLKSELVVTEKADDPSIFGLTASSAEIVVTTNKGTSKIRLGDKNEVGYSYYVSVNDTDKVYLVHGKINDVFETRLNDLRDKSFYENILGKASLIEYKNEAVDFVLESTDGDIWQIKSPIVYNCDNDKVKELLSNIQSLKVARFIEDEVSDMALYGLDKPSMTIKVKGISGDEQLLKAGFSQGNEVYVTSNGKSVHAASLSDVKAVRLSLSDVRDKFLHLPSLENATELTFADATGTIKLVYDEKDGWKNGEVVVAKERVAEFVTEFTKARVLDYEALNELSVKGLEDESLCNCLTIKTKDNNTSKWIISKPDGANVWVKFGSETAKVANSIYNCFNRFMGYMRQ